MNTAPLFSSARHLAFTALLALSASTGLVRAVDEDNLHNALIPEDKQNYAYRWCNIAEETSARDIDKVGARPTIISRQHAIWATSMYDAWAAYDEKAVGSRLGGKLRREFTITTDN